MSAVSHQLILAAAGAGGAGVAGYDYWRIQNTASDSSVRTNISEIEFQDEDENDLTSGGTASANGSQGSPWTPDAAFDNNNTTFWQGPNFSPATDWIQYQFASPVDVQFVRIRASSDLDASKMPPKAFDVQASENGTDWTTIWSESGQVLWAALEERKFVREKNADPRYWRLKFTDYNGGVTIQIAELEFRTAASGPNVASLGVPVVSSNSGGSGGGPAVFDSSTSTYWQCAVFPDLANTWFYYLFPDGVDIVEIAVTVRTGDPSNSPKAWTIQSSTDGSSWSDVWSVSGQTGWTSAETRVFTKP